MPLMTIITEKELRMGVNYKEIGRPALEAEGRAVLDRNESIINWLDDARWIPISIVAPQQTLDLIQQFTPSTIETDAFRIEGCYLSVARDKIFYRNAVLKTTGLPYMEGASCSVH